MKKMKMTELIIVALLLFAIWKLYLFFYNSVMNEKNLKKEYIEQSTNRSCISYKELEKIDKNPKKCKKILEINPMLSTNYYREMEYFFRKPPQIDSLIVKYNEIEDVCYYAESENSNTIFKIEFRKELISNLNECLDWWFRSYEKNKIENNRLQKKFNNSITIQ